MSLDLTLLAPETRSRPEADILGKARPYKPGGQDPLVGTNTRVRDHVETGTAEDGERWEPGAKENRRTHRRGRGIGEKGWRQGRGRGWRAWTELRDRRKKGRKGRQGRKIKTHGGEVEGNSREVGNQRRGRN